MNKHKRVSFFVDGFNLYYSLKNLAKERNDASIKWLNLHSLLSSYLREDEELASIHYFTAIYPFNGQGTMNRHRNYIKALKSKDVKIIEGEFKKKDRYCSNCRTRFASAEEKNTDVNIAIHLFKNAFLDSYDKAVVVSGDSDILNAIKEVKSCFPEKEIGILPPYGKWSNDLRKHADFVIKMKQNHIAKHKFPIQINFNETKINCPPKWL
jgi:uncharacterized LabA/DUF88 family protein